MTSTPQSTNAKRANGYERMAAESGVSSADPHQLVTMLYDGALAATNQARAHLRTENVAQKGASISKAIRIIDEGLKVSLDKDAGGQLSARLMDLYDYLVMRLLQANVRNDDNALAEVSRLLSDLRDSWAQIRPDVTGQSASTSVDTSVDTQAQSAQEHAHEQAVSAPTRIQKQFGAASAPESGSRLVISA